MSCLLLSDRKINPPVSQSPAGVAANHALDARSGSSAAISNARWSGHAPAHAAMRLNPETGQLYFLLLRRAYRFLADVEQARVNLEHALSRNSDNLEAHVYLHGSVARNRWRQSGRGSEAEEIRALQPAFSSRGWNVSNHRRRVELTTVI